MDAHKDVGAPRRPARLAETANFALVLLLCLASAGLLCYITTRRFMRTDWTRKDTGGVGRRQLQPATVDVLGTLDRDVDVTVLHVPTNDRRAAVWLAAVRNVLAEFRAQTGHLSVRMLDASARKQTVERLVEKLGEPLLPALCVVFRSGESHVVVTYHETFATFEEKFIFSGEAAFGLAIQRLHMPMRPRIYVLTDYDIEPLAEDAPAGRQSLSKAAAALGKDAYAVVPLPGEGNVPEDCAALLVAGLQGSLPPDREQAIRDYLTIDDGRAVFMVDPGLAKETADAINALLRPVVARTDAATIRPVIRRDSPDAIAYTDAVPVAFAEDAREHPLTTGITQALRWRRVCPLQVDLDASSPGSDQRKVRALLACRDGWGDTAYASGVPAPYTIGPSDVRFPVSAGVVVEVERPGPLGGRASPEPRLAVFGSSLSFADSHPQGLDLNLHLLRNCMNWMVRHAALPDVPPRIIHLNVVQLEPGHRKLARVVFLAVLPLCVVALGLGVWSLRRR